MEKQSSLSWLREEIKVMFEKEGQLSLDGVLSLIETAEGKEKELLIYTWNERFVEGNFTYVLDTRSGEQFYNETFTDNSEELDYENSEYENEKKGYPIH